MEDLQPPVASLRRVLVISPHFPPVNAPDLHRIRQALPYLTQHGWQAEILTVHADDVELAQDQELANALPPDLKIHRIRALSPRLTRRLGFGGLAYRAYWALKKKGNELLASGQFDLVFFTTSIFGVLPLGPYWKKRYGIPYVIDFQDPWLNQYLSHLPQWVPGGRFKYLLARVYARHHEKEVVSQAAHIISVSPRYISDFQQRYPALPASHYTELPFAGVPDDFNYLTHASITQNIFNPREEQNWVYVGRGGTDLAFSLTAFFTALQQACRAGLIDEKKVHLYFIGTHYALGKYAKKTVEPVAEACGVGHLVTEITERLPYFTTLQCLKQAHALIVPGSADPAYTASKLYPYILAERPLLAIFHEQSSVVRILQETKTGTLIPFQEGSQVKDIAAKIYQEWFLSQAYTKQPQTDWGAFSRYTASAMTTRLAQIFQGCLT